MTSDFLSRFQVSVCNATLTAQQYVYFCHNFIQDNKFLIEFNNTGQADRRTIRLSCGLSVQLNSFVFGHNSEALLTLVMSHLRKGRLSRFVLNFFIIVVCVFVQTFKEIPFDITYHFGISIANNTVLIITSSTTDSETGQCIKYGSNISCFFFSQNFYRASRFLADAKRLVRKQNQNKAPFHALFSLLIYEFS